MKSKIICNNLNEVKTKFMDVCKEEGIDADSVYTPNNVHGTNSYGIMFALKASDNLERVVAASAYWKKDDGKYELQNDLALAPDFSRKRKMQ